jgi:hypothetical protein
LETDFETRSIREADVAPEGIEHEQKGGVGGLIQDRMQWTVNRSPKEEEA